MCRKEARELMAGELAFSLEGPAPSQEAIDARRLQLDPKLIRRLDKTGEFVTFFCMPFGLALVGAVVYALGAVWGGEWLTAGVSAAAAAVAYVIFRCVDRVSDDYLELWSALDGECDGLASVEASDCAELLAACKATPEGDAYRVLVLAEHREFVVAEQDMIVSWANGARVRHACAALYETGEA